MLLWIDGGSDLDDFAMGIDVFAALCPARSHRDDRDSMGCRQMPNCPGRRSGCGRLRWRGRWRRRGAWSRWCGPDDRHVEAHVLVRLGDLDDGQAAVERGCRCDPASPSACRERRMLRRVRWWRRCLPSPRRRRRPARRSRRSGRCRSRPGRPPLRGRRRCLLLFVSWARAPSGRQRRASSGSR